MPRKHRLARYLEERGISQHLAAAEIGITQPFISQIVTRKRKIGAGTALRLKAWSKGDLTTDELLAENRHVAA